MIRGPLLPIARDGLWRLVRQRAGLFERGLRVIAEQIELGDSSLPPVDGLLRDAAGSPVLLFATDDRDTTLPARVLAAHGFWQRNAAGMARALPEADFRRTDSCRLLVVGVRLRPETVVVLQRLQVSGLEVVEVDTFRLGGQERLVVRALHGQVGAAEEAAVEESLPLPHRALIGAFESLLRKLDARIRIDMDRFSRRATLEGHLLAECWFADAAVHGMVPGAPQRRIEDPLAMRGLVDLAARRYLDLQGGAAPAQEARTNGGDAADGDDAAQALLRVRQSIQAARLSREECAALQRETETPAAQEAETDR